MFERGWNLMRKLQQAVLVSFAGVFCLALTAMAGAQSTLSPATLSFGNVVVNTTSSTLLVSFKNTGSSSITINSLAITAGGPYAIAGSPATTCGNPGSLAAGATCHIGLTLSPTALGAQPAGTLTVTSTSSSSPQTVALSGTAVAASSASPSTVAFGNVVVGETSASKTVALYNNQSTVLTINSITPPANYAVSSTTCGSTLAASSHCSIYVTLTPPALGAVPAATLSIATNAVNSPLSVALTGTGIAPVWTSPSTVAFGNQVINTASTTQLIKITNNQSGTLNFTQVLFNGPFSLDTSSNTTCPQSGGTVSGSLAGGAACSIGVIFTPTALGATSGGQITVIDSASNSPQTIALTGAGILPVAFSTSTVAFGNVEVGTTSAAQNVTLKNNQTVALNLSSITVPSPYATAAVANPCTVGTPVPPGGTCVISLTYSPTTLGTASAASVTVADDAPTSPQSFSLTGKGVPAVSIPASLAFGNVVVTEASQQTFTITNNQTAALTLQPITGFSGGYSLNNSSTTCQFAPATLAPGAHCTVAISLTATAPGSQPDTLTFTYNAPGSPQTMTLSATALAPVTVSPSPLSFSAQYIGTTSAAKTVTVHNELNVGVTISSVTITGADPNDFAVTSACPTAPTPVPATSLCSLSVTFTPTHSGTRTAQLNVTDGVTGSPQTITLTGPGNAPVTISPSSITNFTTNVGTTSAHQNFTITNNDTVNPLVISSLQLNGDFIESATTCPASPASLATGASCTVSVEFDPTIGGTRSGQLQVYDNALTSPQVVNLSGTGTYPLTTSPTSLSFSAQLVGTSSAAKSIVLTNHEVQSESFTLTTTGDFTANSNCSNGVIAAQSSCTIFVNFVPSSTTPTSRTGTLTIAHSAAIDSPLTVGLAGSATATNPAAAVAVVSPGAGAAGTAVNVVITGNGWTHFNSSSVISFVDTNSSTYASDITVSNVNVVSPNSLTATLTLAGGSNVVYGARNITVTTPLSGGGTETAKLTQAFIIADPSDAYEITNVNPAFGTQGQTLNVAITAAGTTFVQGTTFANFGDGVTVNSLTILDATDAVANVTISNTTPVGFRTITLVTGGQFATSILSPYGNPIFQIGPNNATLVSVSPNVEPQGFAGPINLTATGTHFLQNATTVSIGNVIVGDVTVTSPTTATAQIAVPANASLGPDNVTVATGGEIATLNNAFTVTGATPALLSVSPSSGQQGQTLNVVITGNAFTTFTTGPLSADFTGEITVNSVTATAPNSVTVNITISQVANVGSITANLISGPAGSATLFPFTFTITPSGASITSVTPNCAPQGGQVTLNVTGLNTNWVQGTTTASFYPAGVPIPAVDEVTINSPTSSALAIAVPTSTPPGTYGFYMATGGQIESASVCVYANTPVLSMSPSNGLTPSNSTPNVISVSFTGQFTHFSQSATVPVISGQGVTLSNFVVNSLGSATGTITIAPGAATGLRLVTFTTGGEIVTTYFNVTSTPVGIINVQPYHGPQNTTMNVELTGLNTHFISSGANPTQVIFGGPQVTVNSITVNSPTDLIANITTSYLLSGTPTPTPPGGLTVYVNTGAEQVITGFTVDAPATPTLLSVVPNNAAQGSSVDVTITGSLTNWVQGQTEAILGAGVTVSNLQITSPTTATATIAVSPTAPVGGNSVIMITGSDYVSGTGFSVTPSAAEIQSVEPNFTCPATAVNNIAGFNCTSGGAPTGVPVVAQLQTITLNLVGVGTHWLQGETIVSFGSGVDIDQLTVSSPTTAQVQITVLSSAPVGFAALTTTTAGEVVTLQQAIDIEEGSPTLLAISPTAGEQAGTYTLQVLGRFTHFQQGVTSAAFNQDITVNSITVVDSETLTANITVTPWAYVDYSSPCGHDLTVTTGSEQVSTGAITDNFCVQQGAEEITSVSPLDGIQGSTEVVTITGSATNFIQGVTTVSFGDSNFNVGEITVNSPTSLSVPVAITTSASTGFKTITVTTYGQVAQQVYSFTVEPGVGTLNEAIPNQAEQGVQNLNVELIGQYTHFSAETTATFGAGITVNSITYNSATQVTANISIDPLSYTGGRLVTVTTPGVPCSYANSIRATKNHPLAIVGCTPGSSAGTGSEIVTDNAFTIIQGPAIITSISPNTGNEGQEVVFTITGSATHWQQNFTQFYIAGGGSDLTINSVVINSPTSATVDMSISPTAVPGTRSIYMVTAGESLTDSGAFVVTGGVPVVTYLSPNGAQPGTTGLPVTINGLYTQWTQAATTISFGPGITVESYTVDNETSITAIIDIAANAQIGYRTVVVQTGTQGLTGNFQVEAPPPPPTPYIWYEYPSSGIPGQTLTINFTGANTEWNPDPVNGTQLTGWNASVTVNSFQITSATTATANVTISGSATASQSTLTFTTPNTASYGTEVDFATFTVVVAQPTLSIVDPGSGMQGAQNLTVNILGQFTSFDSTTSFSFGNGITVNGPPTILGPTIATQSISIGQETPTGGYAVTATTPDVTGSQQVVSGAYFSVTPSLALISAVTPNTAPQGSTITVEVTGQNTHWSPATAFEFGAGIVVSSTQVNSATDATLTIVIPALAPEGTTSVSAHTGGEVASITQGFVVTAGTPLLLSSGPGSLPQQSSAIFTILSQATQWSAATPPTVSYGAGVTLTNVTVTSPTSLTVDGFVQPTTNVGYRNLTVSTGTQVLEIQNAFYVTSGPAVINSVSPSTGGQGVNLPNVQINGINTNWQQGVTTLSFPGVLINSFVVNSPTSITANITVNDSTPAGQVSVTATTLGEVATGNNVFTVTQTQPELLSVVPSSGAQGLTETTVNLTGAFTHFATGTSTANFGAGIQVNSVTASSPTSLQANITVEPTTTLGYRNVSVTTGSEAVSLTNGYQVTVGPAAISNLNPATGGEGNTVTVVVTGSQTHFAQGVTTASFGGGINVTGITVNGPQSATVTISIPASTPVGSYNVTLTTGGEVATILGGFTVGTGTAQLTIVNPATGTQGTSNLSVTLTGQFTHFVQGTSVANFGAGITVNSLTVNSSTSATANITISQTATIASRNVTVTTGSEVATITGGFSVLAGVPALLTDLPTFAQAGTTANVVITGQFTSFQQGVTTVSFGSGVTVNFVTVSSATQVTANITVAPNAPVGTETITVTTGSQTVSLPSSFSITAGTPAIAQISPNIGTDGQTLNVTIIGQYTSWVNGTTTASFGSGITVNSVTVNSATNLTANITIGASTATGPVDVQTTTGGEVENVPAGFTVEPASVPSPTLLSLSPGAYAGGMPINSQITAVFSQPMNRSTINTTNVTLTLTSNPNGYVSVPGTVTLDATGRVMTFAPTSLLAVNSTYNLILNGSIQDAAGTAFSYYSVNLYTVYTANSTPPTVIASNPAVNTTNVGTNVAVQLEFSTDMNQETQAGMTVSTGGNPVAGTYSWNSQPNCCSWGPGTILTFTPSAPLSAGTVYTVAYNSTLEDTAGNALTPGSFTFTTGSGTDSVTGNASVNFNNGEGNMGTNFAPTVEYSKPVNPIDINTGTLLLYNADSGKYVEGAVTVGANGLSATFTPTIPLLPNTYYYLHQSGGYYDMDANYLNGNNWYFTTGAGEDLTPPTVSQVSPANTATSVPLNAQVVVRFSAAVNPATVTNALQVTPTGGGSAVAGTATLASDLVTLTFIPTNPLTPGTQYTVQVSGYADQVGNAGVSFSSSFTTAASITPIIVSTGLNASGNLITVNNTADAHWTVVPTATTPPSYTFTAGALATGPSQPLYVVGTGDTGFYSGWPVNGPSSDWININPNSTTGNTYGVYSTTFNVPGPTVPSNLCLVGAMGVDDNGELGINGTAITGNISAIYGLTSLNIPVSSALVVGSNTLSLGWGSTDNDDEAFRLQGVIETCGASYTGGLTVTSAVPANGATAVATNTAITLNFNNVIAPETVNATTLPVMVGWNSNQEIAGTYQVNGNQVVFTPDSPLPINTTIYVGACGGPLDTAGESAGSCYTQLLNFTTGSTVIAPSSPFQVTAFTPSAGATNVGLRAPVTATFNRSFNPNTLNSADAALFSGDSQSPWCTSYSRSQDNSSLAFTCYALPSSDTLTAVLNSSIQDWSGNALTPFTSQFTTSQYDYNSNGSVITSRPGNAASGISVNEPITIYTNLPINPSTASAGIEVAQNNVAVPGSVQVLDNGYTLEFTPTSPWTPGALIQWWTTGELYDSTYNTPINTASGYFYAAANTSTLVPAVQVVSPADGSTIALNAFFDLQFNTPLNPSTVNSTNIYLYDSSNGLHVAGTLSLPEPNVVRFVPAANLNPSDVVYLYYTTGVQSATSVPVPNTTYQYFYTGTTADSTLPTIVSAVPYNGATGLGVNITPGVVFNKAIDPVSVNSTTFQVTNGGTPLAGTFWFNSSNTRVEFVPNAPLPASTNLAMSLNGVLDQVGHSITYSSSFTTGAGPDFTTPTVVSTSVENNATIPVNSMIRIQFSESMDVTSFGTNNIAIYDTLQGVYISSTVSWSADQSVAYLVPNSPLAAGRTYTLYVNGGTDLAGNSMSGIGQTFYAELGSASTAPTVVAYNPLSNATGLGTNAVIEAEFSAPIDPNTLSGVTLTNGGSTVPTTTIVSAGNTVVQLLPATPLAANTTYVMTLAGVKDPAGNVVATTTNTFTTGATFDNTSASQVDSNPPNYATVGTNVIIKMVFNKPLNPITVNTGTFRLLLYDTGEIIPATVTSSANGLEVTLTPLIPLLPNTEYYFQACCGFQDQDGNNGNGFTWYFYTNGGSVSSGPTVTVSPASGSTGVPLNAQVLVTVSTPMDQTSWTQNSIQLLGPGSTPVAGTVSLTNDETLVFVPASNLAASTAYTVQVSGFTDANGNTVVPYNGNFTTGTAASSGLTFTSSNITNGATGVPANQQIIMVFSQVLDPTTVNSSTLKVMNTWNSNLGIAGTYAVNGNTVTFTPASPYPQGAQITVGECGGPTDILGEVFLNGSCYGQELVYFTVVSGTGDTTPLSVVSVSPASGATNVGHDQPVTVTFNKSVNPGTAGGTNTQLYAGQDLQQYGSQTWSADNRTMTFNVGALYNGTAYTIAIPAGGMTDMSGNALASNFISTFTTSVNPITGNGSVQTVTPGTNTSNVPTNTLLTFYMNRQVDAATLPGKLTVTVNGSVATGTVQSAANGYEVIYTPGTAFPNGATVQWFLAGGLLDVNGNSFNSTSGYFYTAPYVNPATAQPTIVAVSPAYGSSLVPSNAEIDIQYSLPIDGTTLTSSNVYFNGGIPATITQLSPTLVRVVPTTPFSNSTYYYLCANSGVKGTNGVATPGSCWTTYFVTDASGADTTSGTVTIGPPNNVVNVGTNAYIRLQFSKPVDRTTLNSTNLQITSGSNAIAGTWSYNTSGNDVVGANFSPLNPLPASSPIVVSVSGLLDYAGNTFTSATSEFTTAAQPDYTNPSVSLDFPGGATGIGTNAVFTCLYSEPIDPSSITSAGTFIYDYGTSAKIPVTYSFASDLMAVTMTPTSALTANTQYYYACYNAIDLTGNSQSNSNTSFTTGSGPVTTGPTLLRVNPPNGLTNVPVNSNNGPWNGTSLGLLFSEPVSGDSLGNITLTPEGGSPLPLNFYTEYGNTIVAVQLYAALQPNTTYTYSITGVTDYNGNPITPVTSTFTTGSSFDFANPTITAVSPVNGATAVPDNTTSLTLTFSDTMDPVLISSGQIYLRTHNTQTTVPTTLSISADYKTVTLTPTSPLSAATIYDIVYWPNNWYLTNISGYPANDYGVQSTFTTQ